MAHFNWLKNVRIGTAIAIITTGLGLGLSVNAQTPSSQISQGVYLYGQSAQPEQLGSEYLVFQVQNDRVVGASYYPQSEYACFTGRILGDQLQLQVQDPYEPDIFSSYALDISFEDSFVAGTAVPELSLIGYRALETITANDRRLLDSCLDSLP
ncbi:MAG: hypothetical protein AAGG02_03275 [Cyanobacteria bacterium P01_H01_bin.15]